MASVSARRGWDLGQMVEGETTFQSIDWIDVLKSVDARTVDDHRVTATAHSTSTTTPLTVTTDWHTVCNRQELRISGGAAKCKYDIRVEIDYTRCDGSTGTEVLCGTFCVTDCHGGGCC